jgi:hypothetical protein
MKVVKESIVKMKCRNLASCSRPVYLGFMTKWMISITVFIQSTFCMTALATDQSLWVWSMSEDIVMEKSGHDRADFFSFLAAPHGKTHLAIRTVFMSIPKTLIEQHADRVGEFIGEAHSRGIEVHYLTGDPLWALTDINPATGQPFNQPGTDELQAVLNYNNHCQPYQRFDGFQQDVEPYLLTADRGSPYEWGHATHLPVIWSQYLASLSLWQGMVVTNNANQADHLVLGAAIPSWWNPSPRIYNHQAVQRIVDYIAVMDYETRLPGAVNNVSSELAFAEDPNQDGNKSDALNRSVYVGQETIDVSWKEDAESIKYRNLFVQSTSHFRGSVESLDNVVAAIHSQYGHPTIPAQQFKGYAGVAFHYYEDVENGETAFRRLREGSTNHAPVVFLVRPAPGEIVTGLYPIVFQAFDPDRNALSLSLFVSLDAGQTWTQLPETDAQGRSLSENSGIYFWNAGETSPGEAYQLKLVAVEVGANARSNFDRSDAVFSVRASKEDSIPPLADAVEVSISDDVASIPGGVNIQWSAAVDDQESSDNGILGYYFSLNPFSHPTEGSFTLSRSGTLRASTSGLIPVYIRAVDRSGNLSETVSSFVEIFADQDRDGRADSEDDDRDGDGVSNADELAAFSDPDDPQSYSSSLVKALWELDHSGYSNELTSENSLVSAGGITVEPSVHLYNGNQAVHLTAKGAHMSVPQEVTPGAIRALTVELWIKPELKSTPYIPLFFDGDIDMGLSFILKNDADYAALRLYHSGSGTSGAFVGLNVENDILFDGQWHHVACSYNGWDHLMRIWIDGQLAAQTRSGRIPSSLQHANVLRFFDGRSQWDTDNNNSSNSQNSAQFESNFFDAGWETGTYYLGWADDIRVTLAAVPQERLGYYVHAAPSGADTDGDGISDLIESVVYRTQVNSSDSDADGISDVEEINQQTNPIRADTDQDGQADKSESIAGTDPRNRSSFFQMAGSGLANNGPTFSWLTQPGRRYTLWTASSLTEEMWNPVPGFEEVLGDGAVRTFNEPVSLNEFRFYRLQVRQP